jgi:hypothetical protein
MVLVVEVVRIVISLGRHQEEQWAAHSTIDILSWAAMDPVCVK